MQAAFLGLSTGQADISDRVAMDYNNRIVKGLIGYKHLIKIKILKLSESLKQWFKRQKAHVYRTHPTYRF